MKKKLSPWPEPAPADSKFKKKGSRPTGAVIVS